jgi:hypothetical protein
MTNEQDFDDNQVRLQLFAMAYNISNFLLRLVLPKSINDLSLRTMREKCPQQREILAVRVNFCKFIRLERRNLWFIGVQVGNPS